MIIILVEYYLQTLVLCSVSHAYGAATATHMPHLFADISLKRLEINEILVCV